MKKTKITTKIRNKIKIKQKTLIKYGAFLIIISFFLTAVSIFSVAENPTSLDSWLKGLLFYSLGWALLLTGGFITGKYSFKYLNKYMNNKR